AGNGRDHVTKTVKLESTDDKARQGPAARAIVSDTGLPMSRQFGSSAALQRVAAKGGRDRERLARAPRPVGLLRRLARDGGPRLLFAVALTAALAGAYIALGRCGFIEMATRRTLLGASVARLVLPRLPSA